MLAATRRVMLGEMELVRQYSKRSVSSSTMRCFAAASSTISALVSPGSRPLPIRSCRRHT